MSDLISRQAAIEAVRKGCGEWRGIFQKCEENIKAIEAEPVRYGRWIVPNTIKPFGEDTVQCDRCGFFTDVESHYNYCPNCGAKMNKVK